MRQLKMIEQVKKSSFLNPNIRSILMYGSFTKGEGDKYSDIEFYLFLNDPENFDELSWAAELGKVELFFKNEYGTKVAIYDDLIRAEFHFLSVKEIEIVKSWEGLVSFENKDKMLLVDKDGSLEKVLQSISTLSPVRDTPESILWLAQSLVNSLVYTSHLVGRKESAHAHMTFSSIQRFTLWLMRIEAKAFEHWESPSKSLEKDLPLGMYQQYEKLCPRLDPQEIRESLQFSVTVGKELLQRLGVSEELIQLIRRLT